MKTPTQAPLAAALAAALLLLPAFPARAEKADRDKPTNIEANKMSSDEARRMTIFEGNVVLSKGTVLVRADRIVVRQDADGFQFSTAYGKPVRFKQKGDPKNGCEGVWTDGEALRVEIDERNEKVELFDKARVTRDQDVVHGDYIFLDQRTEFFSVSTAKGAAPAATPGRVTAVLQPKTAAPADPGKAAAAPRCPPPRPAPQ
ncbi:MAG TPA: lipopolysaccharide transport periplasmic protein LptA [Burkholderiales bacterium]|nr:lipopolysaccharide transport periplasmic protein LptA [Burkholderiales bacterium]